MLSLLLKGIKMRVRTIFAALLGVASFNATVWAQEAVTSVVGTAPVYQNLSDSSCGCASSAPVCGTGCASGGCGLGLGGGLGSGLLSGELGDPWTLSGFLHGDCEPRINVGGWFQSGYHSADNGLFNNRPDEWNLHQAWLYAEKQAVAGESPLGFRVDALYGIDAQDTQAFGNNPGNWDFQNGFDNGSFGFALPQAYAELALEEWTIKAGHFFTLIGYEVVAAPDNFFYSHAITMYNSEPFTHTGVLASRNFGEDIEFFGGWTAGWDTGFDQFGGGSNWLGGAAFTLTENSVLTYMSTAGDFGARGSQGYSHSIVWDNSLTENLNWIVQSDLLRIGSTGEDNVGLNQYLLYQVNDRLGLGARMEWWKGDVLTGYAPHGGVLPAEGSLSYYAATFGANIRTTANSIIRPEVRFDWSPAANYDQTIFGVDAIFTF
jgi:hypothetical protein